jgi:23S rRNA (cytidine1920-2'-O)/16S rRNA (cytidine1409-2'-O)-methyltransferase
MKKAKKRRLDQEIVSRQLLPTLTAAQAAIMAGEVVVNQQVVLKADTPVDDHSHLQVKKRYPYSSRGAAKLEKAIKEFSIPLQGRKTVDIGISTGGFTDYMLKHGASCVLGIDVNIRQVDYRLMKNDQLTLLEKNARFLDISDIPFVPDLITIDVSFISILKILYPLRPFTSAAILAMIKPQFEAKPGDVGARGIIRERSIIHKVLESTARAAENMGYGILGFTSAGIKGRKGNQEYFFHLRYGNKSVVNDKMIYHGIEI